MREWGSGLLSSCSLLPSTHSFTHSLHSHLLRAWDPGDTEGTETRPSFGVEAGAMPTLFWGWREGGKWERWGGEGGV
jgi:hypothetical protein